MNKQIQSLFDAVYEANKMVPDFFPIHLEHLLRTAEARNRYLEINCWGHINTSNPQHLDEYGEFDPECITKYICTIDLSKSVSEQEEATLIKLSEIIL